MKTKKLIPTLYAVRRINKKDKLIGPIHASDDGYKTVCGQLLNHDWYILTNTFTLLPTCKKCKQILRTTTLATRS